MLSELGYLSMEKADMLRTDISFDDMEKSRSRLRELVRVMPSQFLHCCRLIAVCPVGVQAAMMVRYTLSMSSNDCGGRSEYTVCTVVRVVLTPWI